ncbi:MAG: acetyl-CoA acetyltransferase [Acidimicrobiales bacterium]
MNSLDPRTPVLVGVGSASGDAEATELMTRALGAAGSDAGSNRLLALIDRLAVPHGTWTYPDPARLVADGVGALSARSHLVELGIPQQALINDAVLAIAAGESEVAAVVGGEAKRWARDLARAGREGVETAQPGAVPDVVQRRAGPLMEPVEVAHRLWDPVQQYAMIDNALRAAEGRTPTEHRSEIARLWEGFNRVARGNPDAAFPEPIDAHWLDTPSPSNRPLAFPYNKWHSTQWTVNQAAALLLCSVEAALSAGVPADRWVFPLAAVQSSHAVSLLRRTEPHAWPAMGVLGRAVAGRIGRPIPEVEVLEVYSCFPAAVRVQQRELGLPLEAAPTVTGGMAFAGGPFNNFVLQAMAEVVARVRADPGALGVVTSVSGLLTKPGIGAWSARPDGRPPLVADLAVESEAATGVVEVLETIEEYAGDATVVTYTVTFDGMDPTRTVALCRTGDGTRCVAMSDDAGLAAHGTVDELVGARVRVAGGRFDLA